MKIFNEKFVLLILYSAAQKINIPNLSIRFSSSFSVSRYLSLSQEAVTRLTDEQNVLYLTVRPVLHMYRLSVHVHVCMYTVCVPLDT